jgi:hypothetical protein
VAWGLAHVSSRELTEWENFYNEEPFGERRGDLQAAIVAQTVANALRGKRGRKLKTEDFLLDFWGEVSGTEPLEVDEDSDRPLPRKSPEEMLAFVEQLNAAFGGRDLRSDKGEAA